MTVAPSIAELLCARADDRHPGLLFEDDRWTWAEVVAACAARAALLQSWIPEPATETPHLGVLLGNVPEYLFWLGAAALSGSVVVGLNSTRRGEALASDVARTDCTLIVTDGAGAQILEGLDTGVPEDRVVRVDAPDYATVLQAHRGTEPRSVVAAARPDPADLFLLLFTSGTTGTAKAVRCSQGRLAGIALRSAEAYGFERDDVAYCAMPLFHGNALMVLWGPSLVVGATVALTSRFSASGFVADVRRYGCTTFTYVGKALAYILATPASDDDATTTLRRGFGTEASVADHAAFERRFGCVLTEGYGSSEGGVAINRTPDSPPGSLGRPAEGVAIVDPDTLLECPPAHFDAHGSLINGDQAIGEIVNRTGTGRFEGYYGDDRATAERTRNGWYWSGDLAYRDEAGFAYFAGRSGDWMRVDSENLTAGPIERILVRHPDVATAAVYPVADPRSGDQVMAALELLPGRVFDAGRFADFLAAQSDLGTKWVPSFLRITDALPATASGRTTKAQLRVEGWWRGGDSVLLRQGMTFAYAVMDDTDRSRLRGLFRTHRRQGLIGG